MCIEDVEELAAVVKTECATAWKPGVKAKVLNDVNFFEKATGRLKASMSSEKRGGEVR